LPDDGAARGVGQGVEDEVQSVGAIYNHMVYYTRWFYDCNHGDQDTMESRRGRAATRAPLR
jgi:hypothetical protein